MNAINHQQQTEVSKKSEIASRVVSWMGTTHDIQLTAEETGGALGMFGGICPPGFGPGVHVHHLEDEVFHILEGELEFWLDGKTFKAGVGETVFIPRQVPHCFRVSSAIPARTLTVVTPGGFEGFFEAVASRGYIMPDHMAQIGEIGRLFNIEFLAPPPWPH